MIPRVTSAMWRYRFRLFALLRQISQPSHDCDVVGDEVQLTTEVLPVHLR